MPELVAFRTVEKLNPEAEERGVKPRQRLMIGFGRTLGPLGGTPAPPPLTVDRVLINLEGEEVKAVFGVDLEDFPTRPVKVKLSLEILEG